MGNISENFSYSEFTDSPTATALKLDNRMPTDRIRRAIASLVVNVLQPLRTSWGKPMHVNSGYRCAKLNAAVGGESTSQHTKGEAADIATDNPYELAKLARSLKLPFDQMILYPTFVHFSHRYGGAQRRQTCYNKSYKGKRF